FLDGLERDRLCAGAGTRLTGGADAEDVLRGGTVDLDAVLANVDTATGQSAGVGGHLWNQLNEVGEIPVQRRQPPERGIGDRRPGSGLTRRDHRIEGAFDADATEHGGLARHL